MFSILLPNVAVSVTIMFATWNQCMPELWLISFLVHMANTHKWICWARFCGSVYVLVCAATMSVLDNNCYANTSLTSLVLFNLSKKRIISLWMLAFICWVQSFLEIWSTMQLITWHLLATGTTDRDETDFVWCVMVSGMLQSVLTALRADSSLNYWSNVYHIHIVYRYYRIFPHTLNEVSLKSYRYGHFSPCMHFFLWI